MPEHNVEKTLIIGSGMLLNCSDACNKKEWKDNETRKKVERDKGNGKGGKTSMEKKELFPLLVINQYSSRMLPACAIIINYTQERSWSRKRTAQREDERRAEEVK